MNYETAKSMFEHKYIKMTALGSSVYWSNEYQQYTALIDTPDNHQTAVTLNLCFDVWLSALSAVDSLTASSNPAKRQHLISRHPLHNKLI